ncbi:MAG: tetratricopeptide repeat protein [Bryobacteraceae bacterium]|nr:tetratricopeptide repeat protein [Bryobacteraceae bacterium]
MDQERFERIQALFHRVADLPEAERVVILETECIGDDTLREMVEEMVRADAGGGSVLDGDLAGVAGAVIGTVPETRMVGPYRLIRVAGEGGMGVVYLAEREDLGSQVALKLLRDAWLSPARRERFANEQRTLAQLNHPSIARLYDADTLPDGTPWFVMEFVEGLPLTEYCRERRSGLAERVRLLRAVAEAVQFAHANAVIHRDLKPSNILVKEDGSIRLLDFGIAKQLEEAEGRPGDQTRTGLRMMTPAYAAPEQVRGERAGIYTDIYALGVLLYELVTGRPPFEVTTRTPGEAAELIAKGDPERPSVAARRGEGGLAVRNAVWRDLDVLILKAMHRDPERRYATAEALIRDLDHLLNEEPLEARPDSVVYRLEKLVRRRWRGLAAATTVVVVMAGMAAVFTARLAGARNEAEAEAERAQRIQQFMLSLFQGGDEMAGPAEGLRVVDLLERGAREARALDAEPRVQAELLHTLGELYQKQGDLEKAEELLNQALERRRALHGPEHAEVARNLLALGQLRAAQAKLEEAEKFVSEGLGMARRVLPAGHIGLARALAAQGEVLSARGEYARAGAALEEAARLAAGSRELAPILFELASVEFYAGHYDRSEELNRRILTLFQAQLGDGHPLVADVIVNLGAIRSEKGDAAGAAERYREALKITEAWFGPEHPKTASNLTMLGRAQVKLEETDAAIRTLERAIGIQERHFGGDHPKVASALNELGTVTRSLGRPEEAIGHYRRAGAIWRKVHGENHYLNGIALSNVASVELEVGRMESAEALMKEALSRFQAALGEKHSNTGIARLKLGRVLVRRKKYREAERELRAGLAVLEPQMEADSPWLAAGRKDLAEAEQGLR